MENLFYMPTIVDRFPCSACKESWITYAVFVTVVKPQRAWPKKNGNRATNLDVADNFEGKERQQGIWNNDDFPVRFLQLLSCLCIRMHRNNVVVLVRGLMWHFPNRHPRRPTPDRYEWAFPRTGKRVLQRFIHGVFGAAALTCGFIPCCSTAHRLVVASRGKPIAIRQISGNLHMVPKIGACRS